MKCPVCKDKDLVMSDRQGIEIDYCSDCRGIWLDRGELDKLIDKAISNEQNGSFGYQQKPHGAHHTKHQDYHKHKKKHWLFELLD